MFNEREAPMQYNPLRSVLYVPADQEKTLAKVQALAADAYILDLEDAIAPSEKIQSRERVKQFCAEASHLSHKLIIRINSLETDWGYDDLSVFAGAKVSAILLPKIESAQQIHKVESLLTIQKAPQTVKLWAMMETPLAILNAKEIARSSDRLSCLVMGTSDLAKDLRAAHTQDRLPLITSLSYSILAARAHGLQILDGVHLDLNDDGFAFSCRQGKEMGFDGKTLIHPKTIEAANRLYSPSSSDLIWAKSIVAAYEEAQKSGKAVIQLDGKCIEALHYEQAKEMLSL